MVLINFVDEYKQVIKCSMNKKMILAVGVGHVAISAFHSLSMWVWPNNIFILDSRHIAIHTWKKQLKVHFTCSVFIQVGDGTTTVVLLAGEFLKEAKPFIEDGVHPQNLIRSYRTASYLVHISNCLLFISTDAIDSSLIMS